MPFLWLFTQAPGTEFRLSALHSKHFYLLLHLPSPALKLKTMKKNVQSETTSKIPVHSRQWVCKQPFAHDTVCANVIVQILTWLVTMSGAYGSPLGRKVVERRRVRRLKTRSSGWHWRGAMVNGIRPEDSRAAMQSEWVCDLCAYVYHLCMRLRKSADSAGCAWQSKHFVVSIC